MTAMMQSADARCAHDLGGPTRVLRKYSVPRGLQHFQRARDCPLTTLRVDRQSSDVPYFRRTGNYVLQVCRPGDDRSRALAINHVVHKEF
jgi:hypothetical protein